MRLLRGVAVLLACSLLLPLAAPCAAWAMSKSPLPCCGAPGKSGGCDKTVIQAARAGCCSKALGETQRLPAGIDRAAALDLWSAVTQPAVTTSAPKEAALSVAPSAAQHDILRL